MIKNQITLAEDHSWCIVELGQSKRQLIHIRDTPSPLRNRRGMSPCHSRSRSPKRSVITRSSSRGGRSKRRRSPRRCPPRWSPLRRSTPRRNKRSWSSSSSSSSDDEHDARGRYTYDPFTRRIREPPIPHGLEKPPQMDSYDRTSDLDKHIENIEFVLTYRAVRGAVKCKLFVTTLRWRAMTWFKNLRRNSIDSWGYLCHEFTTHFTASRTHTKTVASLEAIVQGKSEPLRDYIERFNKEVVQIWGADEKMKWYLIPRGLREGTDVKKVIRLDRPETYNGLLAIGKTYIRYEEEVYADSLNKARKEELAAESS